MCNGREGQENDPLGPENGQHGQKSPFQGRPPSKSEKNIEKKSLMSSSRDFIDYSSYLER